MWLKSDVSKEEINVYYILTVALKAQPQSKLHAGLRDKITEINQ